MRNTPKLLIAFTALIALMVGCKKYPDFVGPSYRSASENFAIETKIQLHQRDRSRDSVNFATRGPAYFVAQFNEKVNWTLKIQSLDNPANITFSGVSDKLDSNVVKWYGGHDGEVFFKPGTRAVATLTFLNSNLVTKDTFRIMSFAAFPKTTLVYDFESNLGQSFGFAGTGQVYRPYDTISSKNSNIVIQGERFLRMEGTDVRNEFFIGGHRREIAGRQYFAFPSGATVDNLYVNLLVYSYGNLSGYGNSDGQTNTDLAKLNITFSEDDNRNGTYQPASEDGYTVQVPINWKGGWRLISYPYSSFARETNVNFGGGGNGNKEVNIVKQITLGLVSAPAGGKVIVGVDFVTVTVGGPLKLNQ